MSKSVFTRGSTLVVATILLVVAIFEPVAGRPVPAQSTQAAITCTSSQVYLPLVANNLICSSGAIRGKVFDDTDGNGTDNDEGGVSGAVVGLYDLSDQLLDMPDNPKTTGADGRFRFDGLAPGSYWVKVIGIPSGGIATTPMNLAVNVLACQTASVIFGIQMPSSGLPPDPSTVAPALDPSIVTSFLSATEFLYTGSDPIQTGVAPGTIQLQRAAVLRGRVLTRDSEPLAGVTISVLGHPEFGQTLTRADGMFDLAVNGGGVLTVEYVKQGLLTAQRQLQVPWQDFAFLPDVVMIEVDPLVTAIDLTAGTPIQVARGSEVSDSDGSRQATVLVQDGTQAEMTLPDGTTQPLSTLHMRATEFTVGSNGPQAMPAELPPTSGYTYAVELTADEALAAGATEITFTQPLPFYVENFLGFPVGGIVPTGYYDRTAGEWIAAPNGRVIKVLSVTDGLADLDLSGSGLPADSAALTALGITEAERSQLAVLYQPGQSLWRVPISHFTPWDLNWPYGPPDGAEEPDQEEPSEEEVDNACDESGSIIGCETQTLGESIPVAGTRFSLHYESDRNPGRVAARTLTVSLTGADFALPVKRIELEIGVAGQIFRRSFEPQPNLTYTYVWDGRDAYGRLVQGQRVATVRLTYVYPAVYKEPGGFVASFAGLSGGAAISGVDRSAFEIGSDQVWQSLLGTMQAQPIGLGGWTLNVHHTYDPAGRTLYLGDGGKRSQVNAAPSVVTIAGGGPPQPGLGDGGAATEANLYYPTDVAVAPDGSYYIADAYHYRIRRVGPGGIITTVAGTGQGCSPSTATCGDGGPASQAQIGFPDYIAVGPDGSLYIVSTNGNRVRRVRPDGIITTLVGTGVACPSATSPCGDGGPAAQAQLYSPQGVVAAPDGSVYIADAGDRRIRRIGPDGIITTAVGTGVYCSPSTALCGDGGPAAQAKVGTPRGLALGPDGSLYIADSGLRRVRRVGPDGIITTVAGSGIACATLTGACGDGGPALLAQFRAPRGVAVGLNGSLYITDSEQNRVRRVDPDGSILGAVGTGFTCAFTLSAACGDGGPAMQARFNYLHMAALGPDGTVYLADASNNRIRHVRPFLQGFSTTPTLIASKDGSQVYLFDHFARHVQTLDSLTGAVLYQFTYDTAGRLASVTDGDGNVTSIEHDANGKPTAIVSPYGQRTVLTAGGNGYLASITNPANETVQLASTADGLLTTLTDARGGVYRFTYDAGGRLIKDEDPAGGSKTLVRTEGPNGYAVAVTTALGRTTTYQVEWLPGGGQRRLIVPPSGAQTEIVQGTDGRTVTLLPDGTVVNLLEGPDPRFGMQAPVPSSVIVSTPGGLTSTITMNRAVTLASYPDPFSLTSQTDTTVVNGRVYTTMYDAATQIFTTTSPAGRTYASTIDPQGRLLQYAFPGMAPYSFTYDAQGRLTAMGLESGGDAWTLNYTYNSDGTVQAATDPLGRVTSYTYDAAGRVTQAILPGGRTIDFAYDANGNVTGITPPERPAHSFDYTSVDLLEDYAPPDIGAGGGPTGREHNADRQLTQMTLPTGQTIDLSYDAAGRLETLTITRGQAGYGYNPVTGNLSSITAPAGLGLVFAYDGSLWTGQTWSGPVAGSVTYTYDNSFRTAAVGVNGTSVAVQYDDDDLPTQIGDLTLNRNGATGMLEGSSLGTVTDSWSYNGFGEATGYAALVGTTPIYTVQYTRDGLGRITTKVETITGQTTTYSYDYDPAGQLTEVKEAGVTVASYSYDANGNRRSAIAGGQTVTGTYDAQDRLLQYGDTTYAYTQDGRLESKTQGIETTSYEYDELGNLTRVILPDGKQIEYLIDGLNRRVGKKVDDVLVQGFLYDGFLRPIAELDGAGNLVSRFVYATGVNVPDYIIKGGDKYRIIMDQIGSPRLIVNAATGQIVQRMDYDEFGIVINDTAPGFQPFGFAGGLYDRDTGLVRFGARDYDARTGRWTTKDPIGFGGGQTNLYVYAGVDSINLTDPSGLECDDWLDTLKKIVKWAVTPVNKTPAVINELDPLLDPELAEPAIRGEVSSLQADTAREALERGNVEQYYRIREMDPAEFIEIYAPYQSAAFVKKEQTMGEWLEEAWYSLTN
jgi:RHS repeat-associated protein